MRNRIIFLILVLTVTAWIVPGQDENWTLIDTGHFTFRLPKEFKRTRARGIDSFVQQYASKDMLVDFDFGLYSNNFQDWAEETKIENLVVDGRPARLGTVKEEIRKGFPYSTQIHMRRDEYVALSMFAACKSEKEVAVARKIFLSITIKPKKP